MGLKNAQYYPESDSMGALPGYEPTYTDAQSPRWVPAAGMAATGALAVGGLMGGRHLWRKFLRGKPMPKPNLNPAAAWEAELGARGVSAYGDPLKLGSVTTPSIIRGLGRIARGE